MIVFMYVIYKVFKFEYHDGLAIHCGVIQKDT